jgi:DNA modification methylase
VSDVVPTVQPDKQLHDWSQSEVEADYLIRQLTLVGDLVLDPMCGSATTVCAALRVGRRAVGVEIDPDQANVAREMAQDAIVVSAKQSA